MNNLGERKRLLEALALLAIFGVAAVLRLGWAGVNSYAFDESLISLNALKMARGGEFIAMGTPSSVGVPFLPASIWIFSLGYLFSSDPLFVTQYVGVLSLLAVVGVWLLARRMFGVWGGLTAALFMATSPYAVLYARNIWEPDLLPPLALAWGWAAYLALTAEGRRRAWGIGLNVFLAGFIVQVHFSGAALALGTVWFFLRGHWGRQPLAVMAGIGVALLGIIPYVVEAACCAPGTLDQLRDVAGQSSKIGLDGLGNLARIALNIDWGFLALGELDTASDDLMPALAVGVLMLGGLAAMIRPLSARWRGGYLAEPKSAALAELVLVWLVVSPIFFLRYSTPVLRHYQLVALPALALSMGASAQLFKHPRWGQAATAAMAVVAVVWAVTLGQNLSRAGEIETPNGLGTPLGMSRAAAYGLPDDAPVVFFGHGDDPYVYGEATVFETFWYEREHRLVGGESVLILPDESAYLLATLAPFQAWEEIEASGLASDVMQFARREGAQPFVAIRYDGESEPVGFMLLEAPIRLDDGAQLEGWRARRVGPRLRISTLWRVLDEPQPGTLQQFHHLRTAATQDGEPFMISDVPLSSHNWRAGDRLIVMGDFFVDEAQEFWVDVGHYTLPDGARFARNDGDGDSVRLGPFVVG